VAAIEIGRISLMLVVLSPIGMLVVLSPT